MTLSPGQVVKTLQDSYVPNKSDRPAVAVVEDPPAATLASVLAAFSELLLLDDQAPILLALAGVVANYAEGDPVWPLLVGPPGGGKSEIISALGGAPGVWPLSSLTPQTLISGYEQTRDGKPASLLKQVGEFGIITLKDLTTLLSLHREARAQIFAQLREVADGVPKSPSGTGYALSGKASSDSLPA